MPLARQVIDVPLAAGVDTKTAPEVVPAQRLLSLENAEFDELGILRKRLGYDAIPVYIPAAGKALTDASSVLAADGQLLVVAKEADAATGLVGQPDGWYMHALDPQKSHPTSVPKWRHVGRCEPMRIEVLNVSGPERAASTGRLYHKGSSDVAYANGYICQVFSDRVGEGKGYVTVVDAVTRSVVMPVTEFFNLFSYGAGDISRVKVVAVGNSFVLVWSGAKVSNELWANRIDTTNPEVIGSAAKIATDASITDLWDVCPLTSATNGVGFVVAYRDAAVNRINVKMLNSALGLVDSNTVVPTNAAVNCIGCDVFYNWAVGYQDVQVTWQDDVTDNVETQCFNGNTLDARGGVVTIVAAAPMLRNCGVIDDPSFAAPVAANHVRHYAELTGVAGSWENYITQIVQQTGSGTIYAMATILNAGLLSKPFTQGGRPRVWITHHSIGQTQHGAFLVSPHSDGDPGHVVCDARCLVGSLDGVTYTVGNSISHAIQISAGSWYFATIKVGRMAATVQSTFRVDTHRWPVVIGATFGNDGMARAKLGPGLMIAQGGFVGYYDGSYSELGFHLYPGIAGATTAAAGGYLVNGTYYYKAIYVWTDRFGQIHRSAPCAAYSITISGGGSTQLVTVRVTNLHLGSLREKLSAVQIQLYRQCSDGNYHFVGAGYNDLTTSASDIVDNAINDANALTQEVLYTTGGYTEHICPPPATVMIETESRVCLVADDDRQALWVSKEKVGGEGLAFTDWNTQRAEAGSELTALGEIDGKVIVFNSGRICALAGQGPNALGAGVFAPLRQITVDAGCIERRSLCRSDAGILFKSRRGIYLLGRNETVQYIGAPVEDRNSQDIRAATLVQAKNQIRVLLSGGTCLVYDYAAGQWSEWTGHDSVDATTWGSSATYVHMQNTTAFVRKAGTGYLDQADSAKTAVYALAAETSWIKLGGLQGYQRIWWAHLLMRYYSAHTLNVSVYYDYVDTAAQTETITISADLAPHQIRLMPTRQTCQAIKFKFWDTDQATPYESLGLIGLTLDVGVRQDRASAKLRASKTR